MILIPKLNPIPLTLSGVNERVGEYAYYPDEESRYYQKFSRSDRTKIQVLISEDEPKQDWYLFVAGIKSGIFYGCPKLEFPDRISGYKVIEFSIDFSAYTEGLYRLYLQDNPYTSHILDDKDGRQYPVGLMPDGRWWMMKNYAYAGNGCVYGNDEANREVFGGLYDFETAVSSAPPGCALPTDDEWTALTDAVGENPGAKLKSKTGWEENGNGTDDFSFNVLPSGYRSAKYGFEGRGYVAYFWSSSAYDDFWGWCLLIGYYDATVHIENVMRSFGFSVRHIITDESVIKKGAASGGFSSDVICVKDTHEHTRLLSYRNTYNEQGVAFDTGAVFHLRVETQLYKSFIPKSEDSVYFDSYGSYRLLSSFPYSNHRLNIGGTRGIPDWLMDIVNRVFSCDTLYLDSTRITKADGATFEAVEQENYPYRSWNIEVGKTEEDSIYEEDLITIEGMQEYTITATYAGAENNIVLFATGQWKVVGGVMSWVTVTPSSGEANGATVNIAIALNTGTGRSATVLFQSLDYPSIVARLNVEQRGEWVLAGGYWRDAGVWIDELAWP